MIKINENITMQPCNTNISSNVKYLFRITVDRLDARTANNTPQCVNGYNWCPIWLP